MKDIEIQHIEASDYPSIIAVVNEWWGGRNMADMLPKLFFVHFRQTSFVVKRSGLVVGFLVGFISQTSPKEAYIHFVGVHPAYRSQGIARALYETFFMTVKKSGCVIVRCVTSPANKASISFHQRLGFTMEPSNTNNEGIPFMKDYDGVGEDRVLFQKCWPHNQAL